MKIGVWLGDYKNPEEGGGYSYIDRLVKGIDEYLFNPQIDICFITEDSRIQKLRKEVVVLSYHEPIQISLKEKIKCRLPIQSVKNACKSMLQQRYQIAKQKAYIDQLNKNDIRIIYYLHCWECVLPNFPCIMTNWDIGHLSTYSFPEVASKTNFSHRNKIYNELYARALFVFTESEAGKKELIQYTKINPQRIKVVPIFAGECVKHIMDSDRENIFLTDKNLEKNKYFFYPAQFWAHKNHIGLLKAFKSFIDFSPGYKLALTGSDKGTLNHVKVTALRLGIQDSVLFLGFVSTEEMNALYRNATSLIMASHFGPTNMPPLEALELGCPIICSDLEGHREELGDAALYFNPLDSKELTIAMKTMVARREIYLQRIKKQAKETKFTLENALIAIDTSLCDAAIVRGCWE